MTTAPRTEKLTPPTMGLAGNRLPLLGLDANRLPLLHRIFEEQATRTPDAVAVEDVEQDSRLTYRELDERAHRVAWRLRQLGAGPDTIIGIHLPRGIEQYVSMLGILKAGAAYLPIDIEYPADRVRYMLEDAGAPLVLTTGEPTAGSIPAGCAPVLLEEIPWDEVSVALLADHPDSPGAPTDLCYVIYTSGTSGRPKGVAISHRNAVTFVRAIIDTYELAPSDRILQGFSTTFDASVEEIWMAFSSGGTLVVGSAEAMRAVDELGRRLRDLNITVFSTVPTILSVMDHEDLPELRLLIFGGEAARPDIIEKWARPGRRLMNSYGPTETTVVATFDYCAPDEPVTIGTPLPRYQALVLDDELRDVPTGAEGELCIGGDAVSLRGYLNRPDLTAEKFFEKEGTRFYRTGDLVRQAADGRFIYLGRIDSQVKIRGYRVELEEIETHLARHPDCDGAVVSVQPGPGGGAQLVAYLIQRRPRDVDLGDMVAALRHVLPSYMVPACFVAIDPSEVPQLTSGKINRRAMPPAQDCRLLSRLAPEERNLDLSELSDVERDLLGIWEEVLGSRLGPDDSFFDHGGNSVTAAEMISRCRRRPEFCALGIRDVYQQETVRALARRLEELNARNAAEDAADAAAGGAAREATAPTPVRVSRGQYYKCVTAQSVVLGFLFILGTFAMAGAVALWFVLWPWLKAATGGDLAWFVTAALFALPVVSLAGTFLFGFFWKWVLIGRFKEADYPLWSWGYFRWWLVHGMLTPLNKLAGGFVGGPLAPFLYRLLGAKIGKRVYLGTTLGEADLVTIEDGASLSDGVVLRTHSIEDGVLRLRKVHIGKDAYVGPRAVVGAGAHLGDGAKLHDLSYLVAGTETPADTEWRGSPAERLEEPTGLSRLLRKHEEQARERDFWATWKDGLKILVWQSLYAFAFSWLTLVPAMAEVALLVALELTTGAVLQLNLAILLPAAIGFSAVRFLATLTGIVIGKWVLTGRAHAGTYPINSREYVKRSFAHGLMETLISPSGTRGITETIFMPGICRLLGMKVGKRTEISDAAGFQPDLVSLDDYSTLADRCTMGNPVIHRGLMTLGQVHIGERTFVGNGAHVPITTPVVADRCLVGVNSTTPDVMEPGSDWLGSPPMRLPARIHSCAPNELTYDAPRHLYWVRGFYNIWKMILPSALLGITFWCALKVVVAAYLGLTLGGFAAVLPLILLGWSLTVLSLPVLAKWLLVWRFRPGEKLLWSHWMWRQEIAYEVELKVMTDWGPILEGTPILNAWQRAMGAKIGKRVFAKSDAYMEADLIEVGDDVSLEGFTQTHLFEDRVMKLGMVTIEDGCSVGHEACVLYNSRMGAGSALGDLSLIMKNETFPANGRYRGIPAEPVR